MYLVEELCVWSYSQNRYVSVQGLTELNTREMSLMRISNFTSVEFIMLEIQQLLNELF